MSKISYSFYKVADITQVADSKKIAGAIFFDDATETIHIYGDGGVPKIYGSRKWTWVGLNYSTFVKDVGVGDVVIWSNSEHQLVARKDVSLANTTKVMLMADTGFNTLTFTTSNGGNTWSLTSSILEDFSDFIPNTDASVNPTANSIVKRDNNGDVKVHGIVDDTGNMYALPYSSEEVKDNADAILQMEITDLNTIRSNAAKGATAVQKSGDTMTGPLTVPTVIGDLKGTSDFAKDLTGRIEATPEEFTFRPSAGDKSIRDESAVIRSIKGNSVVWNQRVHNAISPNNNGVDGWYVRQGINNATIQNDKITIYFNSGASSVPWISQNAGLVSGHKYIAKLSYEYNQDLLNDNPNLFLEFCMTPSIINNSRPRIWSNYSDRKQTNGDVFCFFDGVEGNPWIVFNFINLSTNYLDLGYSATFSAKITDLTQMFDAGNEPTTVEEFHERMPQGVDVNAYNDGEIIDGNYEAIETVGFNQWDEQWELGWLNASGVEGATSLQIRNKGYIPILPNTPYYFKAPYIRYFLYDESKTAIGGAKDSKSFTTPANAKYLRFSLNEGYGKIYKNDICINLSHTGVRNGEYEPYEKHIKDLSVIQKYFPNGMRSAGSIYDEIRYNETTERWEAVQRIGVNALSGIMLNYELTEPIITPITEPIQLDYWVEDFGTEKLISTGSSTPLKADIIYQFNATDRIRDNYRNIALLSKSKLDNPNGISAQFVKGDGSLDNNSYADVYALTARTGSLSIEQFSKLMASKVVRMTANASEDGNSNLEIQAVNKVYNDSTAVMSSMYYNDSQFKMAIITFTKSGTTWSYTTTLQTLGISPAVVEV